VTAPSELALPTTADIDVTAAWESIAKTLARVAGHVEAGRPVWWRRADFRGVHADVVPKWHVFTGRRRVGDWDFRWSALCGYENQYSDLLGDGRRIKVTTPKKIERCAKCDQALTQIREKAAA